MEQDEKGKSQGLVSAHLNQVSTVSSFPQKLHKTSQILLNARRISCNDPDQIFGRLMIFSQCFPGFHLCLGKPQR